MVAKSSQPPNSSDPTLLDNSFLMQVLTMGTPGMLSFEIFELLKDGQDWLKRFGPRMSKRSNRWPLTTG